jgi:hypothetical protein
MTRTNKVFILELPLRPTEEEELMERCDSRIIKLIEQLPHRRELNVVLTDEGKRARDPYADVEDFLKENEIDYSVLQSVRPLKHAA